jgi:hypothetical protein
MTGAREKKTTTTQINNADFNEISLNQLPLANLQPINNDPDDGDFEKTDEEILREVLSELGGSAETKINVYQVEQGKPMAFAGSFAPDNFSLDAIQASYGAGEYMIHVRSNGRLATRRVVRIAKPLITPLNNTHNDSQNLAQIIAENNRQLMDQFKSLIPQAPAPKSTIEMLTELKLMKEVLGGEGGNSMDAIKVFMDGMKMGREVAGDSPEQKEPSTTALLMEGVKSLGPILAAGAMRTAPVQPIYDNRQQINTPPAANVQIQPIENAAQNAEILPPESQAMSLQEQMFFNLLISNAERDNSPEPYANMLLDLIGNDQAELMLNDYNWFKTLCEKEPRAQAFEAWFTELRAVMLEIIVNEKQLTDGNSNDINGANTDNSSAENANTNTAANV